MQVKITEHFCACLIIAVSSSTGVTFL